LIHAADISEQGEGDELLQATKVVKGSIRCFPGKSQWVVSVDDTSVDKTGGTGWDVSRVKFLTTDASGLSHEFNHNSNPSCSVLYGASHPYHQVGNAFEDTDDFYSQTSKDSSSHNLGWFVGITCNDYDFEMGSGMRIEFEQPCETGHFALHGSNYKVLYRQCGVIDPTGTGGSARGDPDFEEGRAFTPVYQLRHAPRCGELTQIYSNWLDKCEISPGMNNDGTNMEDSARHAWDEGDCCDQCEKKNGCVGWTFVPGRGNECWLKNQVGNLRSDEHVISGKIKGTTPTPGPTPSPGPVPGPPQQCGKSAGCVCSPAMNNDGHNMHSSAVHAEDESNCCDQCQQTTGCVGWTFVPKDGNACWLKDSIGALHADDLVTSGALNGIVPVPPPSPPAPVPSPPPPTPSPAPSDCPGGSLDACINLCPIDDEALFKACVRSCQRRCTSSMV